LAFYVVSWILATVACVTLGVLMRSGTPEPAADCLIVLSYVGSLSVIMGVFLCILLRHSRACRIASAVLILAVFFGTHIYLGEVLLISFSNSLTALGTAMAFCLAGAAEVGRRRSQPANNDL